MISRIRKRDGRIVDFELEKIAQAIFRAAEAVGGEDLELARKLAQEVADECDRRTYEGEIPSVEDIQDIVEKTLIENGHARTAKTYILYRDKRSRIREAKTELMDIVSEILVETSRGSAFGGSPAAKMLQIASLASRRYYLSNLLPQDIATAHLRGDIHIHNLEYYSKTVNNLHVDLERMLEKAIDIRSISAVVHKAVVVLQNSQTDLFGVQCFPHFDRSMGALIRRMSRQPDLEEIIQSMHTLVYDLNALHTRIGARVPLSTLNVGNDTTEEGRAITKALLLAVEKATNNSKSNVYPRIVFSVSSDVNMHFGDPNYDLLQFAITTASRCENPTFSFMDTTYNGKYQGEVSYMGCRTRVIGNWHGGAKCEGRGNIATVSVNLPRIALRTRNVDGFLRELEQVMTVAVRQLLHRFEILSALRVRDLPFVMGRAMYMGSETLKSNDAIRKSIINGTLALGFGGLAEALIVLVGEHHGESQKAQDLGLHIVRQMRAKCDEFAEYYNLNVVLSGAFAQNALQRFARQDAQNYGVVSRVTDVDTYTDSFHVPMYCQMSEIEQATIEGAYHKYCNGGHITQLRILSNSKVSVEEQAHNAIIAMREHDIGYGAVCVVS